MSVEKTDIELLYKDCCQRMLTVAQRMLKDDDEASDTVSDVFARLADGSLTLPEERPENYLLVTVRNLCLDRIHRMTIRERVERRLTLSQPSLVSVESDQIRAKEMIDYAERTFPKLTWQVFQLRFDEGLQYREIAERLGFSEVTVYRHLTVALQKLKEKYNPTRR